MIYVCMLNYLQFLQSVVHCHILPKMDTHWVWMLFFQSCARNLAVQIKCKSSSNPENEYELGKPVQNECEHLFYKEHPYLVLYWEKELWTASLVHRITYAGLVLNSGYGRYTSCTLSTPKQFYPYMQSLLFQLVMYTIQSCSCIIVNSYW